MNESRLQAWRAVVGWVLWALLMTVLILAMRRVVGLGSVAAAMGTVIIFALLSRARSSGDH